MSKFNISAVVYEYHYDNGFTGQDSGGWDPNLQFAWSRIAASEVCKISEKNDKIIKNLIVVFGQDELIHEIVGIKFHSAQIISNSKFCTKTRIKELKFLMPKFAAGEFPKKLQ